MEVDFYEASLTLCFSVNDSINVSNDNSTKFILSGSVKNKYMNYEEKYLNNYYIYIY